MLINVYVSCCRVSERSQTHLCGTSSSGELVDYETLALRLNPPAVEICNVSDPERTLITIASANRAGTLVEVVQGLTELGLDVHRARISSDGGAAQIDFIISAS
jgi:UTP:GlnB (protein PII) uridylyltransferase